MPDLQRIETKIFIKYLQSLGAESKKINGTSHAKFHLANLKRPIVIVITKKEMPGTYIRQYLKILDKTVEQFLDWLGKNK